MDLHHRHATIPLRPPTQTAERERRILIRQARIVCSPPGYRQLLTSGPSSEGAHIRWNSAGAANGDVSELWGAARGVALDATGMRYVISYSATELRTFHCDHVHKTSHLGLDPSMLVGFLCIAEADWIDL